MPAFALWLQGPRDPSLPSLGPSSAPRLPPFAVAVYPPLGVYGPPCLSLQPVSHSRCLLSFLKPFLYLHDDHASSLPRLVTVPVRHTCLVCCARLPPWEAGAGGQATGDVVPTKSSITGNLAEAGRRLFGKLFREGLVEEGSIRKGV